MTDEYRTLRHNINMLGRFLGETINDAQGEDILTLIENVRQLSKQSRAGDSQARKNIVRYPFHHLRKHYSRCACIQPFS